MQDFIRVDLQRLQQIIDGYCGGEFYTADIIRAYSGGFYSNRNTPACYSFNAQFGQLLKRNENQLGIMEIESGIRIQDDLGHHTSTSVWCSTQVRARRRKETSSDL